MFYIRIPEVTFHVRAQVSEAPGYEWRKLTTRDVFSGRRVVVFAVPGCYTPTCTSNHLPGYEAAHARIAEYGIDDIYCLSVNDSYTMNAWLTSQGVNHVKALPDGSGEFTRKIGFLVDKSNQGMGMRSWRYSMCVRDGIVEALFSEPGLADNTDADPFVASDAETMIRYLESARQAEQEHKEQSQQ